MLWNFYVTHSPSPLPLLNINFIVSSFWILKYSTIFERFLKNRQNNEIGR